MLLNPLLPLFLLAFLRPFLSCEKNLIAASMCSWTKSTAFTMWPPCSRSFSETCLTLFSRRSSTRPSLTPHVRIQSLSTFSFLLLVFAFHFQLLFRICSIGSRRATKCHPASDLLTSCLQQWHSLPSAGVPVQRGRPRQRPAWQRGRGGETTTPLKKKKINKSYPSLKSTKGSDPSQNRCLEGFCFCLIGVKLPNEVIGVPQPPGCGTVGTQQMYHFLTFWVT